MENQKETALSKTLRIKKCHQGANLWLNRIRVATSRPMVLVCASCQSVSEIKQTRLSNIGGTGKRRNEIKVFFLYGDISVHGSFTAHSGSQKFWHILQTCDRHRTQKQISRA